MRELHTEIDIDASPEQVWGVLADFERYREWNPFIVSVDGSAEVGARLTVRMQPVGARAITLRPTVLEVVHGRHLCWLGRLGLPSIFDAEHDFSLEPAAGGGTRLR